MARTTNDTNSIAFSIKMPAVDRAFLDDLVQTRAAPSTADIIRQIVESQRTIYGLPSHMAERIQEDLKSKKQDILNYVRDLLGKRYEELAQRDLASKKK